MGAEDDFSETHAPVLKLNDAAWTITCGSADVEPISKQSLPKYALEALHNEGRVPDPLAERNEEELRWVALEVWTFTRSFDVPKKMGFENMASRELVLEGVDTVASVTLNGKHLADLQNAHRQHRIDVDKLLKSKGNILAITIKPAVSEALSRKEAYPYTVPFVQAPRALPHYNFLRKPASDFGWDWGPAFAAAGLGSVALECCKGARITSVMVRQEHTSKVIRYDEEVEDDPEEEVEGILEEKITLHFDVTVSYAPPKGRDPYGNEHVRLGIMVRDGRIGRLDPDGIWDGDDAISIAKKSMWRENNYTLSVFANKEDVDLWWPNGYGGQYMYGWELYLADTCHDEAENPYPLGYRELSICHWKQFYVGLRDIKLVREPLQDGAGETFEFHVNGVPIFAKGANVIPLDIMPSRVTEDYVNRLVWTAKYSHMNMLRVWGGGGYLPDSFYSECSRCGILVWQEAMFACAFYPRDVDFLIEVEAEVRYQSRRLNQYTCMAVWGGNNELEPALGWFPESKENPIRYAVDFAELFINSIRAMLTSPGEDKPGKIPFVDSSPSNGIVSEEPYVKRWGDSGSTAFGDVHYYNYDADVLDPKIYPEAKFISEFGFQSWPSWPAYKQVTGPGDWSLFSPMSKYRMRHPNGIMELEDQLVTHFRLPHPGGHPEDFQKYIYLTQIQQGLCYQAAIGKWRSLRSDPVARTMGILYWQLNDIWAGPSWSTLDFGGHEKLSHDFVRRAYQPLMLWGHLDQEAGRVTVHLISDLMHPIAGDLKMSLIPWAAKKESECSCSVTQVSMESRQSKAVAVLDLKHLQGKLAGDLEAGFLALKFTGTAEGKQCSATTEVYLCEFYEAKLPKHSVKATASMSMTDQFGLRCFRPQATIVLRANAVAALVALETEELQGSFSTNAFTMVPWETYSLTFERTDSAPLSSDGLLQDLKITSLEKAMRQPKRKDFA